MNLTLHIVRKDLLRLRWQLAVWLLVVALKLGIGFSLVFSGGFGGLSGDRLQPLTAGLYALELLLTFVLTAMLVQEDSLVGTTQFWLTRPISGARLLVAKFAGWLLLLWLPTVVVTLPWWLTCGYGGREIAWAALEMLAVQAAVSAPAALVAAVTDTLSRVLIWSLVLLAAVVTIPGVLLLRLAARPPGSTPPINELAGLAVLLLTVAGVVVHQFSRRDVVRSLTWFGVGVALSLLVVAFPVVWFATATIKPRWTDWHPERASGITLTLHSFNADARRKPTDDVLLNSYFEVRGLPRELALVGGTSANQTWRWPGGPVITRDAIWVKAWDDGRGLRAALGVGDTKRDEETEKYNAQWLAERITKSLWNRRESLPPVSAHVVAAVSPATVARIRQTPPAYEAAVQLRLLRPELWLEVPLKAGGWHARSAHGFRLGPVALVEPRYGSGEAAGTNLSAGLPVVTTNTDFFWDSFFGRPQRYDDWRGAELYVVRRAGGDVQRQNISRPPRFTISSVCIQRTTVPLWRPTVRRGEKWVPRDPNWLEGVTVALVGFPEEARFTAEVKAERYEAAK